MTETLPHANLSMDSIEEDFAFFDSWEDRYGYVIDLGRSLPPFPDAYRDDAHQVRGCQSQVWMVTDLEDGLFRLVVDSDALIVKGLGALVMAALDSLPPAEAAGIDVFDLFERLGLLKHLSPTRGNGLRAMVERAQRSAAQLSATTD
jgi:SufE protein probably involved in Fe-S center assembly